MQRIQWFGAVTHSQLGQLVTIAHIINRLLTRQNELLFSPSSLMKHLPTPTPAVWEGVGRSLDTAFSCLDFYMGIHLTLAAAPAQRALRSLQEQLLSIPFNLLAGHLPNMELSVTKIMR